MIAVIAHAEFFGDQVGYPLGGPDIGGVTPSQRPLEQQANEPVELPAAQERRASGDRLGAQGRRSAPTGGVAPAHHGAGVAPHFPRHVRQGPVLRQQGHRAPAARLQSLRRSEWSHPGVPPLWDTSVLHYLYRSQ